MAYKKSELAHFIKDHLVGMRKIRGMDSWKQAINDVASFVSSEDVMKGMTSWVSTISLVLSP